MFQNANLIWVTVFAMTLASSVDAKTGAKTARLCDDAAHQAAREFSIPVDVLLAITRVETGLTRDGAHGPWPWTINLAGKGHYYDTADEAIDHIERARAKGARSFDVGCFQINHKWHGQAFASIPVMFDPVENARYAAQYLQRLRKEMGSWKRAIGAYHSRTAHRSAAYRNKVEKMRKRLGKDDLKPPRSVKDPTSNTPQSNAVQPKSSRSRTGKANTFPFLKTGASDHQSHGSLVPLIAQPSRRMVGG